MMTKGLRIHSFILQIKFNEIKHFVINKIIYVWFLRLSLQQETHVYIIKLLIISNDKFYCIYIANFRGSEIITFKDLTVPHPHLNDNIF